MPIFRAQVNYIRGVGEKWSNVWHCTAADIGTAITEWTVTGVPGLLPLLDSSCQIKSLLVNDPASDDFGTVDINEAGTSTASGDLLPLFNTCKVLFPSGGFGRPDLKYFKGFVTESIQTSGNLLSGTMSAVDTIVTALIADMDAAGVPLVSNEGDPYTNCSVQQAVQMRQMHRKRKKSTPTP